MSDDPWPFPADTPLERARKIALAYRSALYAAAPEECRRLDDRAITLRQGWVAPVELPEKAHDGNILDAVLSDLDIEHFWRIPAVTIRAWASKGLLERRYLPNNRVGYRVGDVLDVQARRHSQPNT